MRFKKLLFRFGPLIFGLSLVYISLSNIDNNQRNIIYFQIINSNLFWVLISILLGLFSHYIRAIRWRYLLDYNKINSSIGLNFITIMTAYLANLGIPRSGEFLRSFLLSKRTGGLFEVILGTIVVERIIDMLCLVVLIIIIGFLNVDLLINNLTLYKNFIIFSIALILLLTIFVYVIGRFKFDFLSKFEQKLIYLREGILSVNRIDSKFNFYFFTVLIWLCYILMFYVIFYSIDYDKLYFDLSALLTSFISGAFAMTATNGGIGLYPIAVSESLVLFNVPLEIGLSIGWIMWICQTLMVVLIGALSFLYLSIFPNYK